MADILSAGELLIDFTPAGAEEDGRLLFSRNPGGAPANLAVQAVRSGVSAGFLGSVGNDMFGAFLKDTLDRCGVDTAGLFLEDDYATSLAFVQLSETGDRDFSFYRDPGADTRLDFSQVDLSLIDRCKIFCFGSLLMTAEPSRSTIPKLAAYAKSRGKLTAYDPNWRPALWKDQKEGVRFMQSLVSLADIMKVSDEELFLITGKSTLKDGAQALLKQGVSLVMATLGPKGCAVFTRAFSFEAPTYNTQVKDTTGSGDSFFGSLLAKIAQSAQAPEDLTKDQLMEFADFANAAGAVCATKPGGIPALPDLKAIEACQKEIPLLK